MKPAEIEFAIGFALTGFGIISVLVGDLDTGRNACTSGLFLFTWAELTVIREQLEKRS